MSRGLGTCSFVLHTHLPYVHHPEWDDFLEEDWLFEAMSESYLPLLMMADRLERDGVAMRLAMSITPPLLEMLRAPRLLEKFENYIEKRRELMRLELDRLRDDPAFGPAAAHYAEHYDALAEAFAAYDRNLPGAFRRLQENGRLEILASSATHGFLPLFAEPVAVAAQIRVGLDTHEELFGRRAEGFWLPECAWHPDLEAPLLAGGIRYVIFESHGITSASPTPPAGTYRPIELPQGLAAFGRDRESGHQVWSSEGGYPGDPDYRELYRDLGFDGDYRRIRPFLKPDGIRRNVGIKYHRITGRDAALDRKEPWNPEVARDRARTHAGNFLFNRSEQVKRQAAQLGESVSICAPYDTELFGHWWYEGPWFLEEVFRQAHAVGDDLPFSFATPTDVLDAGGSRPRAWSAHSTWGADGFAKVWLNEKNAWFWPYLHEMQHRMVDRAAREADAPPERKRILDQMARELLLAESSDWPFIMTMDTSTWYAESRFRSHVHRFFALERSLDGEPFDEADLVHVEETDAIFPHLDYRIYR